jgi:hypothetical protein
MIPIRLLSSYLGKTASDTAIVATPVDSATNKMELDNGACAAAIVDPQVIAGASGTGTQLIKCEDKGDC